MTTDDILLGLGLVVVVAVGAQLVAARLRLPAIVVLLPAGFLAGIATGDVHPERLLGPLYQPFVSLAVGVILFEAGLRLSFAEVAPHLRRLVGRLVVVGVLLTWAGVAGLTVLLFGLGDRVPLLIGAILVVSGPTVVMPLLAYVRPVSAPRAVLTWEGVLVDPIGALLAVVVFQSARSGHHGDFWQPGELIESLAAGAAVGAIAAAVLWLLLRETQRTAPRQAVPVVLMMVIAAVVGADLLREDAGFVAVTLMGVALANQRTIDVTLMLEFQGTLVRLLIGVLFVLIAASVTPSEVSDVLAGALALVAVMALVIRPLVVLLATWRSSLSLRERAFVAWVAPRGIVAGATASAFGLELQQLDVPGAEKILPIVFVTIFGTVVLYGLTAAPVARWLGVATGGGRLVLVVGGNPAALALAEAFTRAGVRVRVWVGRREEQEAARAAGLDADRGRMLLDALSREVELEEVTDAVLLTASDDFNALAGVVLRAELGHARVYRVAPDPLAGDLVPPAGEAGVLAGDELTYAELARRIDGGAEIVIRRAGGESVEQMVPLFVVGPSGALTPVTVDRRPPLDPDDTVIALTPGF